MTQKIIIIDDNITICKQLTNLLREAGYETKVFLEGESALREWIGWKADLFLLDIHLPGVDGFSVCRELRALRDTPMLMLSARGEEYDRIHGFELGVDDYVVKPFSPRELMMRVGAILKRSGTAAEPVKDVVTIGGLTVDFTARMVTLNGEPLDLSPKEYDLLFYMVRNRGIALTREKLISEVWGYDFFGDDRTLDTHIKLLRRRLGDMADHITTLRGGGYRFEKE